MRDQASQLDQKVGSGGTTQSTYYYYDNYGRLSSKHLPIYSSSTTSSVTYNADDTIATATDPRGLVATYTYNKRHSATGISYDKSAAPSSVAATSSLSYTYDDAGNRTEMSDGTGTLTYVYDVWSRLTSETKAFTGVTGTFALSYTYNLGGQLTSVTDPWGGVVDYTLNDSGEITSVGGTNYTDREQNGSTFDNVTVSSFGSDIEYRAWGALKGMTFGDGNTLAVSYNNRLQVTEYDANLVHATYQYRKNGQKSYMHDVLNNTADASWEYDDYGRLATAKSGAEANGAPPSSWTGAYKESFTYDVWNHMTGRTERFWSQDMGTTGSSFTNNRAAGSTYDASGHILVDTGTHTYDAAGNETFADTGYWLTFTQTYDGDGRIVYRDSEQTDPDTISKIRYYVRSTVLGGNVVAEMDNESSLSTWIHVYANGAELAEVDIEGATGYEFVSYEHINPVSGAKQGSARYAVGGSYGLGGDRAQLDPLGQEMGDFDPYTFNASPTYEDLKPDRFPFEEDGNPFDPYGGCSANGMPTSCAEASRQQELDNADHNKGEIESIYQVTNDGKTTPMSVAPTQSNFSGHYNTTGNPFSNMDILSGHLRYVPSAYMEFPGKWVSERDDFDNIWGNTSGGHKDLRCISASELVQMPQVKDALDAARKASVDSGEKYSGGPRENGGFIFLNRSTGEIEIVVAPEGTNTKREIGIDLDPLYAKTLADYKAAGKDMSLMMAYHTHPGSSRELGHYASTWEPELLLKWAKDRNTAAMGLILDIHRYKNSDGTFTDDRFYDSWSPALWPTASHRDQVNVNEMCLGLTDLKEQRDLR